jgi:hypothetical protein
MNNHDRCPDCRQVDKFCTCYVSTCPRCGCEVRILGVLEDRDLEETCDDCKN